VLLIVIIASLVCNLSGEALEKSGVANFLSSQGQYQSAIAEYYKSMYNGSRDDSIKAYFSIAKCNSEAGKQLEALHVYKQIEKLSPNNWQAISSHVKLLSDIHYFNESNRLIDSHLDIFSGAQQDTLLLYYGVNLINLGKYDEARVKLGSITNPHVRQRSISIVQVMDSHLPLKTKSATQAILMQAVLPGAGYMYCKMPQTAVATLLTNALMGYTTYDNFKRGNTGSGVFFSVFTTGFYLGSVFGSMQAVSRYNQDKLQKFKSKIHP
jgi:hypothetical protein